MIEWNSLFWIDLVFLLFYPLSGRIRKPQFMQNFCSIKKKKRGKIRKKKTLKGNIGIDYISNKSYYKWMGIKSIFVGLNNSSVIINM